MSENKREISQGLELIDGFIFDVCFSYAESDAFRRLIKCIIKCAYCKALNDVIFMEILSRFDLKGN